MEDSGKDRASRAVDYYKSGFNCSQSVVLAFADLLDIDENTALRVSASFGGGIGRMKSVCGAACGMFILAGLYKGATRAEDQKRKLENYELVRKLAGKFTAENGSLVCAELKGVFKRPCLQTIASAVRIWEAEIRADEEKEEKNTDI